MSFDLQDPDVPIKSNFNPTYLDVPVLFNYNFVTTENINFFMSAGIFSEILIKANDNTTFQDNTIRDSGYLNSFLLGTSIGLGIKYKLNENVMKM